MKHWKSAETSENLSELGPEWPRDGQREEEGSKKEESPGDRPRVCGAEDLVGDKHPGYSDDRKDQRTEHNHIKQSQCPGVPIINRCNRCSYPPALIGQNLEIGTLH